MSDDVDMELDNEEENQPVEQTDGNEEEDDTFGMDFGDDDGFGDDDEDEDDWDDVELVDPDKKFESKRIILIPKDPDGENPNLEGTEVPKAANSAADQPVIPLFKRCWVCRCGTFNG